MGAEDTYIQTIPPFLLILFIYWEVFQSTYHCPTSSNLKFNSYIKKEYGLR